MDFPWTYSAHVARFYCVARCSACALSKVDTGVRRNEMRPCLCHHSRNIQQMVEMSVRHQNRVHPAIAGSEMTQSIVDPGGVRLNVRTKCYVQKVHSREVRIDKQGVAREFESVTVRSKISYAHAVTRCAGRICNNQIR